MLPGQEYPQDLANYPDYGEGWMNEEGMRIDMQHRPSTTSTVSQVSFSTASLHSYRTIFDRSLEAYKRETGKDLTKDPLFHLLENCKSPDAVLTILRAQILEPGQPQSSRSRLTMWLDPTVNVLIAFSPTVGALVGQVSLDEPLEISELWSDIIFGGVSTRGSDLYWHWSPPFSENIHRYIYPVYCDV